MAYVQNVMITISYYRQGKKHEYQSSNMACALERKNQLIHLYGKGFNGVSWFTIERPEDAEKGFLQKPAL